MRITLWLTRPGVYLLIFSLIAAIATVIWIDYWIDVPREWAWLLQPDRPRRRRITLAGLLYLLGVLVFTALFFLAGSLVLRLWGVKVHGRDPSRPRRKRDDVIVEESWEIRHKE